MTDKNDVRIGKIRDSNRPMLRNLFSKNCRVEDYGILSDDPETSSARLMEILGEVDVLVTTGGVSMGSADWVKPCLEANGEIMFGRICMKPGKPTTFAVVNEKLCFALPGNPVSAFVTSTLFVVPTLKILKGLSVKQAFLPRLRVRTATDMRLDPVRPEYHRAVASFSGDGDCVAVSTGNQLSSRLLR